MKQNSHAKWAVAVAAVVALVAGGLALGSNMGFKFNMPLDNRDGGFGPPAGDNRMSFPLLHPYTDREVLCQQLGLTALSAVVQQFNPNGGGGFGTLDLYTCGSQPIGSGLIPALVKGRAVFMTDPSLASPSSAIQVGSHDPAFAIVLEKGTNVDGGGNQIPPSGDNWVSVPLHTTSVVAQDFCDEIGPNAVSIAEFDPDGPGGSHFGSLTTYICGSGTGFTYTKGRAIKVVLNNAAPATVNWLQNHF